MQKQNSIKTIGLCFLALLGSIFLSLNRIHALESLVTPIQQEFQSIDVHNILIILIILGTISNAFMQAWIIRTLLRILKVKSPYLQSFKLFALASFSSLVISQPFINHAFFVIISGITLAVAFCIVSYRLFKGIGLKQQTFLYSYGFILGALQIWMS